MSQSTRPVGNGVLRQVAYLEGSSLVIGQVVWRWQVRDDGEQEQSDGEHLWCGWQNCRVKIPWSTDKLILGEEGPLGQPSWSLYSILRPRWALQFYMKYKGALVKLSVYLEATLSTYTEVYRGGSRYTEVCHGFAGWLTAVEVLRHCLSGKNRCGKVEGSGRVVTVSPPF